MGEPDVATKAPESDPAPVAAADPPAASSDTPAPSQGLGEHCTTDRPTPAGQASTGEITKLDDIDVSHPPTQQHPHLHLPAPNLPSDHFWARSTSPNRPTTRTRRRGCCSS